jgi:biopolymer transport protein ExbB
MTMFDMIKNAGWPAYPLILASVIALAIIIERFISLRGERIIPSKLYDETIEAVKTKNLTPDVVVNLSQHSPLGSLLSTALRQYMTSSKLDHEDLQGELEKVGRNIAHNLEKYMTTLGSIAAVAPLMGLFGTVIGMIEIFEVGNNSAGSMETLSKGISIALYNTALGLVVAIPALVFWRYFRRKIDFYLLEMEQISSRFCNMLVASKKNNGGW